MAEILRPFIQWMWQKFCNDSYTGCCRNSATTHTLDVAEILRPHSYTGCRRNSAIIHDHIQGVADILRPIIHWVLQKFCNHSDTESGRKSATIHTQWRVMSNKQQFSRESRAQFNKPISFLTYKLNWIFCRLQKARVPEPTYLQGKTATLNM